MSELFSRRSFLKLSGALVAASALAACSGGGGGSTGGGGDQPYNPSAAYHEIDGGLKLSESITGGHTKTTSGSTIIYLNLAFKNTGTNTTIQKEDFQNVLIGNTSLTVLGFAPPTTSAVTSYSIPSTNESEAPTIVPVYFSANNISDGDFTFNLVHGNKKAVCKGNYPLATWTIDVQ